MIKRWRLVNRDTGEIAAAKSKLLKGLPFKFADRKAALRFQVQWSEYFGPEWIPIYRKDLS